MKSHGRHRWTNTGACARRSCWRLSRPLHVRQCRFQGRRVRQAHPSPAVAVKMRLPRHAYQAHTSLATASRRAKQSSCIGWGNNRPSDNRRLVLGKFTSQTRSAAVVQAGRLGPAAAAGALGEMTDCPEDLARAIRPGSQQTYERLAVPDLQQYQGAAGHWRQRAARPWPRGSRPRLGPN